MEDKILTAVSRGIDPDMLRYYRRTDYLVYTFLTQIPLPIITPLNVSREVYFDQLITAVLTGKHRRLISRKIVEPWVEDIFTHETIKESFTEFADHHHLPLTLELINGMSRLRIREALLYGGVMPSFDLNMYHQYGRRVIEAMVKQRELERTNFDNDEIMTYLHRVSDDTDTFKQFIDSNYALPAQAEEKVDVVIRAEDTPGDALTKWDQVERADATHQVIEFMNQANKSILQPTIDYPINQDRLQQWVDAHLSRERPFFRKLAHRIRYVAFTELYQYFVQAIEEMFTLKGSTKYCIIVPDMSQSDITLFRERRKSNWWMTQIALRYVWFSGHQLPTGVYDSVSASLREYPNIHTFVMFDDAIFSGNQIKALMNHSNTMVRQMGFITPITFYVAVAMSTSKGMNHVTDQELNQVNCVVIRGDEIKLLIETGLKWDLRVPGIQYAYMPLIYFQHKMPDAISVPYDLLVGRLYPGQETGERIPYIEGCEVTENCPPAWYRSTESGL